MVQTDIYTLFVILLFLLILLFILYYLNSKVNINSTFVNNVSSKNQTCREHSKCNLDTCGKGIDALSDPSYNMKQIIKQSILLEEHLVEPNKRCRDCIFKHFNHIIALHEEALWLANEHCKEYPLLEEVTGFYTEQFDIWINSYTDDKSLLVIAGKLRDMRKKLVFEYYFKEQDNLEKSNNLEEPHDLNLHAEIKPIYDINDSIQPRLDTKNIESYERIY